MLILICTYFQWSLVLIPLQLLLLSPNPTCSYTCTTTTIRITQDKNNMASFQKYSRPIKYNNRLSLLRLIPMHRQPYATRLFQWTSPLDSFFNSTSSSRSDESSSSSSNRVGSNENKKQNTTLDPQNDSFSNNNTNTKDTDATTTQTQPLENETMKYKNRAQILQNELRQRISQHQTLQRRIQILQDVVIQFNQTCTNQKQEILQSSTTITLLESKILRSALDHENLSTSLEDSQQQFLLLQQQQDEEGVRNDVILKKYNSNKKIIMTLEKEMNRLGPELEYMQEENISMLQQQQKHEKQNERDRRQIQSLQKDIRDTIQENKELKNLIQQKESTLPPNGLEDDSDEIQQLQNDNYKMMELQLKEILLDNKQLKNTIKIQSEYRTTTNPQINQEMKILQKERLNLQHENHNLSKENQKLHQNQQTSNKNEKISDQELTTLSNEKRNLFQKLLHERTQYQIDRAKLVEQLEETLLHERAFHSKQMDTFVATIQVREEELARVYELLNRNHPLSVQGRRRRFGFWRGLFRFGGGAKGVLSVGNSTEEDVVVVASNSSLDSSSIIIG